MVSFGIIDCPLFLKYIAVAIKKLREEQEYNGKVVIIDIDTHYGDGIAKIFYEESNVLYSSIHEFDYGMGEAGFFSGSRYDTSACLISSH